MTTRIALTCPCLERQPRAPYVEVGGGRVCLECAAVLYSTWPDRYPGLLHVYLHVTEARAQKAERHG